MKTYRSGDHAFHEISEMPKGEKVKHNGRYTFRVGEASNHNHIITVPRTQDLEIIKTDNGVYFNVKSDGWLSHVLGESEKVADHKTIPIKKGFYFHVIEREIDFMSGVVRQVKD